MTALLSYLPKCENPAFFLCRNALPFHMGNQTGPYTEKPPQAVSSPILNPNSRTFWNDWKDSADRTTPPPGNSACRDGHSPCRACYIKEIHKQQIREVEDESLFPGVGHNSTPRSLVLTFSRWRCWALACCFA